MTVKIEDITADNSNQYNLCCICSKLFHCQDMKFSRYIPNNDHGILGYCVECNMQLDKQENEEHKIRTKQMNETRLNHIKEYLARHKSCDVFSGKECDCSTSNESGESQDEHSDSEHSESEHSDSEHSESAHSDNESSTTSDTASERRVKKKSNNNKSIKLEFWISL